MFWSASFGPMGGQGGVCMSIVGSWQPMICDKVVVVPSRAQFVMLQFHDDLIGLLNVRWRGLQLLESPEDRIGGGHGTVHGSELAAWEQLCMSLRILDAWFLVGFSQPQGSLSFSRSD